jgi:hypothetical protein
MATFSAQVVDLVGAFSDETALDSFITEGANEVINAMPRTVMERVAEETTFTNTVSSEGHKILHVLKNDGTIDQPCRLVLASKRGRIQDSSDMEFATSSDPAYYIQDSLVTLFPTGSGGKLVSVPTYNQGSPLDASGISTITNFPNEYEYLVTLYAAVKALQQLMTAKHGNSDITTALTAVKTEVGLAKVEVAEIVSQTDNSGEFETACDAIKTELDKVDNVIVEASTEFDKTDALLDLGEVDSEAQVNTAYALLITAVAQAATAAGKFLTDATDSVFGDEDTFLTANSQLTRVKDAVDKVSDIVNGNQPSATTDAFGAQAAEDTELVQSALSIASVELQRAQMHLQEWTSIGDMRVKEVNTALAEADGQIKVVQTHLQQAQAKREESQARISAGNAYLQEAQAYIAQANGYAVEVNARSSFVGAKFNAIQGYLNTAQGYVSEAQARLSVDTTEYNWYQTQQAKLQADYDKGIQIMRGA